MSFQKQHTENSLSKDRAESTLSDNYKKLANFYKYFLTPEAMEAFATAGQWPFFTRSTLEALLAGVVHFGEEGLRCLVELCRGKRTVIISSVC